MRDVEHQSRGVAPVGPVSDAVHVAHTLRREGPLRLDELRAQPDLRGWSADRLESAVVAAWSQDLITVDARDHLVAL